MWEELREQILVIIVTYMTEIYVFHPINIFVPILKSDG